MEKEIEQINKKMQQGYSALSNNKYDKCFEIWLETWKLVAMFMNNQEIKSISQFDSNYKLTQYLYNWATDFIEVLQNCREYKECILFCEWLIPLYMKNDKNVSFAKITRAEAYFNINKIEEGEKYFKLLTDENPKDVWAWINWSDQYHLHNDSIKDYKKSEDILLQALKIDGIEEITIIYERLADLYRESNNTEKLDNAEKLDNIKSILKKESLNRRPVGIYDGEKALAKGNIQENIPYGFGSYNDILPDTDTIVKSMKIGRNELCPCASGKKYKKCCLGK